jgi:tRNA nucleotidyltransferase (CCA-adding enzyme)
MNCLLSDPAPPHLDPDIRNLLASLRHIGGRPLIVGGWVRDNLLGIQTGDMDIEVFHLPFDTLRKQCRRHGRLITVGAAFAVLKLTLSNSTTVDISIPRRERKTGEGHTSFRIQADPDMTVEEAAQRRDLTINAISMDPFTGMLLDPVQGIRDLKDGMLRHVGSRFSEDPLRVLRVYRFQARFGFEIAPETRGICRSLSKRSVLQTLARERIEDELRTTILQGKKSFTINALSNMHEDGVIHSLFPELDHLAHIEQDPRFHAEGNVLVHTFMTVAEAASIAHRDNLEPDIAWALCLAALVHDLGKAHTSTVHDNGTITAHGHDKAGRLPAQELLDRITEHAKVKEIALALATNHMRPLQLATAEKVTDSAFQRLAVAVQPASIILLSKLVEADTRASVRGDGSEPEKAHLFLLDRARNLGIDSTPPKPFIQGRDLIHLANTGIISAQYSKGGPHFSGVLKTLYQLQINGAVSSREDAVAYLRNLCTGSDRTTGSRSGKPASRNGPLSEN